jgi:hypothetical protein
MEFQDEGLDFAEMLEGFLDLGVLGRTLAPRSIAMGESCLSSGLQFGCGMGDGEFAGRVVEVVRREANIDGAVA